MERVEKGSAKVLGKLSVPGSPTYLDNYRAWRAIGAAGVVWTFFSPVFLSLSLSVV